MCHKHITHTSRHDTEQDRYTIHRVREKVRFRKQPTRSGERESSRVKGGTWGRY